MRILIILLLLSNYASAQLFTKKDIAPMILVFSAGHATGWRDEVLYHPNELFRRFPDLGPFFDIRVQNKPGFMNMEFDADHVLKGITMGCFVAAVVVKIGDKKKWYYYIWDAVKYTGAYHIGFYTSYNLIHNNKL